MPLKKRKSQKRDDRAKNLNLKKKTTQTGGKLKKKNTTTQTGGKLKKDKKESQLKKKKQNGGKLNAFFKLMLAAKKKDLSEFKYNGNTYKQFTAKTGLKMYKKA